MNLYEWLDAPNVYNLKTRLLSFGRRSVRRYLQGWAERCPAERVLDIGCGTGSHGDVFSGRYWGVDRNFRYVCFAKRTRAGLFLVTDATRVALPDATFDFVFCSGLFHHLPDEQVIDVMREMKRVLVPGGQALAIDGVFPSRANVLGYLLFKLDRGGYVRTLDALTEVLRREDFKLVQKNIPGSFPCQRAAFCHWKPRKNIPFTSAD